MSPVNFKTRQVKIFYSEHDHFEYSQITVEQDDQQEEEALVTSAFWQVDGLRIELIRHHRDKRLNLHEMKRSETTPVPKDQLLDERETHIDYQKSKKKVLYKEDWRVEKKRFSDKMEELWKGKTIYKIKDDCVIPEGIQQSDIDRLTRVSRGNIDDLFHPESASSSKPVSVQKKPSSQQREVGKRLLRGPGLKTIEVGPPAAKRHVGKQKPVVVDDGSSKGKKVVVSYPDDDEDFLDRRAKEMGLKLPDDEPEVIESKSSAPARARSKQDSEGQIEKLGSEDLEPGRVSVPLPGSEVQAMTPAYKKMLKRLEDSVELYNFMSNITRCLLLNSEEGLPCLDFLILFTKSMKMCVTSVVRSTSIAPPPRARVSGIRTTNFGDVIYVDHAEIMLRKNKYMVLLVLDGATNLLWAMAQSSFSNKETIQALRLWTDENNCVPKAIVGDVFPRWLSDLLQNLWYKGMSLWFKNPLARQS